MEGGKKLVIDAPASTSQNKYVQALTWNGKPVEKNYLNHFELQKGGTLNFTMSATPNKTRGTKPTAFPYSFSVENKNFNFKPQVTFKN